MSACPACRGIACRCVDRSKPPPAGEDRSVVLQRGEKFVPARRCDNCEMWVRLNELGGHCYARPPVPYFRAAFDGLGSSDSGNLRPYTEAAEWCGEFEQKVARS